MAVKIYRLHYAMLNDAGEVVDSSQGGEPLVFTPGDGRLIAGLEKAIVAEPRQAGDEFMVVLTPEEGYGHRQRQLVRTLGQEMFEQPIDEIRAGELLQMGRGRDAQVVRVVSVAKDGVTVDGNHPLAGFTLRFGIQIVAVEDEPTLH